MFAAFIFSAALKLLPWKIFYNFLSRSKIQKTMLLTLARLKCSRNLAIHLCCIYLLSRFEALALENLLSFVQQISEATCSVSQEGSFQNYQHCSNLGYSWGPLQEMELYLCSSASSLRFGSSEEAVVHLHFSIFPVCAKQVLESINLTALRRRNNKRCKNDTSNKNDLFQSGNVSSWNKSIIEKKTTSSINCINLRTLPFSKKTYLM